MERIPLQEGRKEAADGDGSDVPSYPIRAVDRACDLLDVLRQASEGVSLASLAERARLPKSSAYRYLCALEARHYVERDQETGFYKVGLALAATQARQVDLLVECAKPELLRLRDDTSETANLGVLDGTSIIHLLVVESPHMLRLSARVGERVALHATALGKAIAAQLPQDRVRSMLAHAGTEAFTARTIISIDDYLYELERVRRNRYALDDCENQEDGKCIAVALRDTPVTAGISVSAPATRIDGRRSELIAKDLEEAALEIAGRFSELTKLP